MALKSVVYKAELSVADMDRHHYQDHSLTLARHPSETEERMMVRILAYAANASEIIDFSNGISNTDEPDLWQKDLTGEIELWVDVGLPDERLLRKACGRSKQVKVYCYSSNSMVWWRENVNVLSRLNNLSIYLIPAEKSQQFTTICARTMRLQFTIQESYFCLTDGQNFIEFQLKQLK